MSSPPRCSRPMKCQLTSRSVSSDGFREPGITRWRLGGAVPFARRFTVTSCERMLLGHHSQMQVFFRLVSCVPKAPKARPTSTQ